jgi:hypothetical protein
MSREMYFLRDVGFIQPRSYQGFLDFTEQIEGANLVDFAEPTPIGWSCLALRKEEIPADWLRREQRANLRLADATRLGLHLE